MILVDNIEINTPLIDILKDISSKTGLLDSIRVSGSDIQITCPEHSHGHEKRPSCFIRINDGVFHCFTCGISGNLITLVSKCFACGFDSAKKWLIDNYSSGYTTTLNLEPIEIFDKEYTNKILNESILNSFENYHPYFTQRHISDEIINKFELKYDNSSKNVIFPVRDENGKLVGLTKRNINFKRYELEKFKNKPVYLLYNIIKDKIKRVVVVEGQIDALVSWSYGVPAIALFGAGTTEYQLSLLKNSGILEYILMYDNDEAGRRGSNIFKKYMSKYAFITDIVMPQNIDVGDCSKEQFYDILSKSGVKFS